MIINFHKFSINSIFFLKAPLMIWVFIWGLYCTLFFFLNDIASHCKKPYEPKSFMGPKTACRFFGKFCASNGQRDLDTKKQTAKHLRFGSFLFQSVILRVMFLKFAKVCKYSIWGFEIPNFLFFFFLQGHDDFLLGCVFF